MDIKDELVGQFREQRAKFVYYVIALCVTSIGFSVYRTTGQPLSFVQIPLGLALICWGISIFCGFRFLGTSINTISANLALLRVVDGTHPDVPNNRTVQETVSKKLESKIKGNNERADRLMNSQQIFFYLGIILFITWHILLMYNLTDNNCHSL